MSWIRLDDRAPRHPKIAALSDRAFRWWIAGLCYSSEFLTDGVLPSAYLQTVPGPVLASLQAAGLWTAEPDGTAHIHDYLDHQSDRASVEQERARNRRRKHGSTGGSTGGTTGGSTGKSTDEVPAEYRNQSTENRVQSPDPVPEGGYVLSRARVYGGPVFPPAPVGAGTFPRDHIDHGFCGTRFCLPAKTFVQMAHRYGENGDAKVAAWLRTFNDALSLDQSFGGVVWLLQHFDAWLVETGRVLPVSAAAKPQPPIRGIPPDYGTPGESYIQRVQREREAREAAEKGTP